MSIARHHAEWLSLVPVSGPFLSLPVLMEAFPQGLDAHDPEHARLLRQQYSEWQETFEKRRADPAPHQHWIKFVLTKTLDLDDRVLAEGQAIPQTLQVEVPEHHELLRPSIVVFDPNTKKPRLLVQTYPRSQELTSYVANSPWKASPDTRMTELLHATGVRLGLVTNGEHWMLVDAPKGETTGYASWYAALWLEESITLRAFRSLLSASRFFNVPDDQILEALLTKSASNQQEVTDQLGYQVRKAVEVLIHSLDRADQDFGRELLADVTPEQLYESALTVMMRLVFLFCAEERELIPSKPFPVYEQNYSVSTISKQLRELADQHGEELLERRYDAWPRLLAAFRAVHGGLQHDDVHIPAYGGNLFNPDRFPFLEGRKAGTTWTEERGPAGTPSQTPDPASRPPFQEANPLPVNNRTVLHLLEALQLLQIKVPGGGPAEARRLSFRALDIEQIGHVYEGLLDHTAKRAAEPFLGLAGTREKEPEISLAELENQAGFGDRDSGSKKVPKESFWKWLKEQTGRSESALMKALSPRTSDTDSRYSNLLRTACQSDDRLLKRIEPFAGLVRLDNFGYPVVIPQGSVFVTAGTDRRSSGTHYTPRSLTEPIVQYTLEPLVYVGPAEGKPKSEWKLKSAAELLSLKICDMACGSGAFLVQAARYMAERLLEAWERAERGSGTGDRGSGGNCDGDSELSGPGSVEAGDGLGSGMLSSNQDLPEGRAFRNDQPDSPLGSVDSSEPRRGARARAHQGVPESLEHRPGVADGSTDPSSAMRTGWTAQRIGVEPTDADLRACQPNDFQAPAVAEEATIARSSAPAPRLPSSPSSLVPHSVPRITPDGRHASGALNEELIPDDPAERQTYAMRIIAQRCLYGVDKNPLAVEMAKLSLWLLTLAKDKPFEFLDHSIRCGDSLVGLHSLDQLRHYSLQPDADDAVLFRGPLDSAVDEAIDLRLKLEDLPTNTVEDVQRQEKLLNQANEKIARLRCAADLLVAAEYWGENAKDKLERARHAANKSGYYVEKGPTEEFEAVARKAWAGTRDEGRGARNSSVSSLTPHPSPLTPFHWPLEFPEVIVQRGGFDAFVGNPPFVGGRRIRSTFGEAFLVYLTEALLPGTSGNADLCAFFFRRAAQCVRTNGGLGLLATNTIAQGDTRATGLDAMQEDGFSIFRAVPSRPWPGSASLEVAHIWLRKGPWAGPFVLDDKPTRGITSLLSEPGTVTGQPHRLKANEGKSFQGSIVLGMGFVLEPEEAQRLLDKDPRNKDVLFPYLNGEDLNSRPDQSPSRWVINFFDWPIERAREYPDCFRIIEEKVKPERTRLKPNGEFALRKPLPQKWWIYADKRPELYRTIAGLERVLVRARIANMHSMAWVPKNWVYNEKTVVFPDGCFVVLQSTVHESWARNYSTTLRTDMQYTPSDCFHTFPFPVSTESGDLAEHYSGLRKQVMLAHREGLTKTYNRFHNPDETSTDIQKLRDLHVEMDQAVAGAYGWTDLDLDHGFHETKQGVRFTISEPARREVLSRLLKLNHERYAEEVKQGLHEKKGRGNRGEGRGVRDEGLGARGEGLAPRGQGRAKKPIVQAGPLLPGFEDDESEREPEQRKQVSTPSPRPASSQSTVSTQVDRPVQIDDLDTEAVMAAFRQAARGKGWLDRGELLKEASQVLGYQRLGPRIEESLRNHLRAALRRRIIEADGPDLVRPGTTTMADYDLEELRATFASVMRKGAVYEREDVIYSVARYLGFARLTDNGREPLKSAINSAIRQGILGYEGSRIWREA